MIPDITYEQIMQSKENSLFYVWIDDLEPTYKTREELLDMFNK